MRGIGGELRVVPDEVQGLVLVPDSPASPPLIQEVSVVLGPMGLYGVPALVPALKG